MSRHKAALLIASFASLLGVSCTRRDDAYWVGAVGQYAGDEAARENLRGIQLAVSQVNRSGGIHGHLVRLVTKDDAGRGDLAARIAHSFVADERVSVVVGHTTSAAMIAAAPVYDRHLVAIATTASAPALTGISPWVFRVIPSDSVTGARLARFAASRGWHRAAILYENDVYGRGLADAFSGVFPGTIVSSDPIVPDAADLPTFVRFYERFTPDVIFVITRPSYVPASLRDALANKHLPVAIVASEGSTDLEHDVARAEDIYTSAPFSSLRDGGDRGEFKRDYEAAFGNPPMQEAALAYDAAVTAFAALAAVGPDRAAIRGYLRALDNDTAPIGATGRVYFDSLGDRRALGGVLLQVKRGHVVALADTLR
ncbi:MAG TPA: ABC transporter substrate-binding protein [Gemmatimonadaceae bacterium]|nr:ABC transporter substrate-binding protein [Gemmatimonadaceae bacterium]